LDKFVSILLPVYNEEKCVSEAVYSILAQSYKNYELLIINDGSIDKTGEVILSIKDDRIKYYSRAHLGIVNQLNFGLSIAKGELIARMDADDVCHPNRLEKQIKYLDEHPEISLVGSNIVIINEEGGELLRKEYPRFHDEIEYLMPVQCSVCHASMVISLELMKEMHGYNSFPYTEDLDLFLRILAKGYRMHNLQEYLYSVRRRKVINTAKEKVQAETSLTLSKNFLDTQYQFKKDYDYYLKSALANYYYGELRISRNILIRTILKYPLKIFILSRYLTVTLLGEDLIKYLRKIGFLQKLNYILKNTFRIETQFRPKIKELS
jgi:glycosyltransferase involved in cell wall biosynthesis